jgi:hypothetical protein
MFVVHIITTGLWSINDEIGLQILEQDVSYNRWPYFHIADVGTGQTVQILSTSRRLLESKADTLK